MPNQPFDYTPEQLEAMSVEDAALAVLKDAHANDEWNSYNWMNLANRGYGSQEARKLSQAWNWLYTKGAVSRDYSQPASDAMFVTDLGLSLIEYGAGTLVAEERLSMELHPLIDTKARRQFVLGEYGLAVLAAFKQVEIRVRELIDGDASLVGVDLMNKAFGDGGRLYAVSRDGGELNGRRELFKGAIAVFKNPESHREVAWDNPVEAAEAVLFADLLMRMEAPVVVQCTGGDDYPNETGTVNLGVVDTATDALVDFIRDKTHWYPEGYTQFNLPDGNIVFGYPFESDPTLSVINVWVVQSDNGWQVDSWESSAC